jgi:predicted ATPase
MRLDRVYIDGFKNLKNVEIDFDRSRLTTVVIGQNGAGKSNLIEAIADVFRYVDVNSLVPCFDYQIDYRIGDHDVTLFNRVGKQEIIVDGTRISRKDFDARQNELFPDMIFGYYSGGSRRLERLFDSHQRRYYDAIKTNNDPQECLEALTARRLFYCRPIHGVFALLAFFANREDSVTELLKEHLGVVGFDSALAHLREPWFAKGSQKAKLEKARDIWGAEGPAGTCARRFRDCAFHPLVVQGNAIDDYRDKQQVEAQLGAFLRNESALSSFSEPYANDRDLFYALEAMDISDIIRELHLWVTRVDDASGDVSFADLSDGERQLLMVLGLIRVARGRRCLFLLDEPDTHLNPLWQHRYLQLIQEWTGVAAAADDCQIILTSHNPLTIAALEREDVRVMYADESGKVSVSPPYTDPRGMGFTATLTEIFGLPTTLDRETQREVDDRNQLAQLAKRTKKQERDLIEINDKLNRLGFTFEDREPLYQDFLHAWRDVRYADRPPLTTDEIKLRQAAMSELIKELSSKQAAP